MTAVIPDVDTTLDIDFDALERDVLDTPCEAADDVHADEFVPATMLWLSHCTDMAFCDDCHLQNIDFIVKHTGAVFLCSACGGVDRISSDKFHPLGPIK